MLRSLRNLRQQPAQDQFPVPGHGKPALLVDDLGLLRMMIADFLESSGPWVLEAQDANLLN